MCNDQISFLDEAVTVKYYPELEDFYYHKPYQDPETRLSRGRLLIKNQIPSKPIAATVETKMLTDSALLALVFKMPSKLSWIPADICLEASAEKLGETD